MNKSAIYVSPKLYEKLKAACEALPDQTRLSITELEEYLKSSPKIEIPKVIWNQEKQRFEPVYRSRKT